jgi:hypothetical protein
MFAILKNIDKLILIILNCIDNLKLLWQIKGLITLKTSIIEEK